MRHIAFERGRVLSPGFARRSNDQPLRLGTVKNPCTVPADEAAAAWLKKRTLTNRYNERRAWLDLAHRRLDEADFAAYDWPAGMTDDALLAALLERNLQRAAAETHRSIS